MGIWEFKEYRGIHNWVERRLGKPKECWNCGDTTRKVHHWANISGNYLKEIGDWRRLCVPCHATEKNNGKCKNGHDLRGENVIYRKATSRGIKYIARICRICQREYKRIYRKKFA